MMSRYPTRLEFMAGLILPATALLVVLGCAAKGSSDSKTGETQTLTLGAYTTPREVFGAEILPAFNTSWRVSSGQSIAFEESYLGSGAQARAIASGFEADVAALSLEPDLELLQKKGLIAHDWQAGEFRGMVTNSLVVIGVRPGNPKNIKGWEDLARPGIAVLTPSPRTSGGAMWNVTALYAAALRGRVRGTAPGDSAAAERFLKAVLANVAIMDKGGRESMLTFEHGAGDAVITYENEVLAARDAGKNLDYIIPDGTLLIESPVAVVDAYAKQHGTEELARAFVQFLTTPGSQRAFAKHGFRPVDAKIAREYASKFPSPTNLVTIRELGGWPRVIQTLFDPGAAFDRATAVAP